jgi:hypothetical protein
MASSCLTSTPRPLNSQSLNCLHRVLAKPGICINSMCIC